MPRKGKNPVSDFYKDLVGTTAAAKELGCSPSYIRNLCQQGKLLAQNTPIGRLVTRASLDALKASGWKTNPAHGRPRKGHKSVEQYLAEHPTIPIVPEAAPEPQAQAPAPEEPERPQRIIIHIL